jgi:transcriptional antiterminator NusG
MLASHEDSERPDAIDATPADETDARLVAEPTPEDEEHVSAEPLPAEERAPAASDESEAGLEDSAEAQPEAAAAPAGELDDGRAWYVIHCYSGYENKVRYNLEQRIDTMEMKDRIFDIVIPTIEEIEIKEGKRRNVERRVFPGYLLVQMLLTEESWYVVRNTPGVTGFVGMGNTPTALRPEEVTQILKRMETSTPQVRPTYKAGQRVRVIDGPFNEFIGTVGDIDMDRGKVRVLVSFFGRETPVELDFLQVEKA